MNSATGNILLAPNSGNVGIGTVNPFWNLDIQGNTGGNIVSRVKNNGIGRAQLYLDAGGNSDASIQFMNQGASNFTMLSVNSFFGLHDDINSVYRLSVTSNGYVGIGTITPGYLLDVNGAVHSSVSGGSNMVLSKNTGSSIEFNNGSGTQNALIEADNSTNRLEFWTNTATNTGIVERMRINNAGNVAIGTTDPKGYKLAVAGSVVAESMTVKLQADWPDYTFKKDYKLMPLSELKTYVDKNQHLPEVPSAAEVTKDGQNLGEMNKLLLKKVEELTLYLIAKDKQDKIREQEIAELKKQVETLTKTADFNK